VEVLLLQVDNLIDNWLRNVQSGETFIQNIEAMPESLELGHMFQRISIPFESGLSLVSK